MEWNINFKISLRGSRKKFEILSLTFRALKFDGRGKDSLAWINFKYEYIFINGVTRGWGHLGLLPHRFLSKTVLLNFQIVYICPFTKSLGVKLPPSHTLIYMNFKNVPPLF